jgi:sterol desaturase/sphingolipid hydroxylase (fatty acid hydroxylase superfamily)
MMFKLAVTRNQLRENYSFLLAIGAVLIFCIIAPYLSEVTGFRWLYRELYLPSSRYLKRQLLTPLFLVGCLLILLLERFVPADPKQRSFSAGFYQDIFYFLLNAVLKVTLILAYLGLLTKLYRNHFSFLSIASIQQMPFEVRFLIGVLVADFSAWFHHFVRHKVSLFWQFHAIHHSQKFLNLFTEHRNHFLDNLIASSIQFIPLMMFFASESTIAAYAIGQTWYTRLYHANIRSNFGIFRYVFVTPQSHRIHHSILPEHQDKNFGVIFSIWDRIFGTQYHGYNEYPETGIADPEFPYEEASTGRRIFPATIMKQLIYPFRVILRNFRKNPAILTP